MKKAIYVRSALENEISIETQIDYCKTHLKPNDEYVIYSDNGYSAHNKKRPAFKKMMSAIEKGEIDTVIVYKFDRICRDIDGFCTFVNTLYKQKATFISTLDNFDTSTDYGKTLMKFAMIFGYMEIQKEKEAKLSTKINRIFKRRCC